MNPTNEQELRDIVDQHTDDVVDARVRFHKNLSLHAYQVRLKKANSELYEAITAHTNAEIAKEIKLIRDALVGFTGDNAFVIVAIDGRIAELQAERAKLKEVE